MMSFLLSSKNVASYLDQEKICSFEDFDPDAIELKTAKNFNLLLTLQNGNKLLIKQERRSNDDQKSGEFLNEWKTQEYFSRYIEHASIRCIFPEIIHFDPEHSIVVFNYLDDYQDLLEFYVKEQDFSEAIASELGLSLALVHRLTGRSDCRDFWLSSQEPKFQIPNYLRGIERIRPEIFGIFPVEGLQFLTLYQRYDSLSQAISNLISTYQPSCLTHNDLKLNNLLLHKNWVQYSSSSQPGGMLRIIDWERSGWGDPAFDLGSIVASYLSLWLSSMVISKDIAIEESLRMAMTPLETLQPSLRRLVGIYLNSFPEILQQQPHFLQKVVQYNGLALIQQIQSMIQYQKVFNNIGICLLQVAKSCLCRPHQSIYTIFGVSEAELVKNFSYQTMNIYNSSLE